jgi:hypothetical protein
MHARASSGSSEILRRLDRSIGHPPSLKRGGKGSPALGQKERPAEGGLVGRLEPSPRMGHAGPVIVRFQGNAICKN